jgi:lipopolysaccharide heptosyltransferase I
MMRFLIVRLGALGDIVHAIPVAAALRRAHPTARIDWLVSAKHAAILDLVTVLDRRVAINDRGDATGGMSILAALPQLRRGQYDIALDLQGLVKSALLARWTGASRIVGFTASYARERLARLFYTDVHDPGRGGLYDPRETRHVVEINLGLLSVIGIPTTSPEFPIADAPSDAAKQIRDRTRDQYALLNPGAAWPNKRWPPARLAAVARALHDRYGLTSVTLWGPGEESLAQEVVADAAGAAIVSPATTIADLVALTRHATVMVSGDTGPTHIASAVGTPIVGLYGPTRPARNGPLSPLDVTVSRDATCACHHLRQCTRDRMCLLDIEVEEVVNAIERRLAAEPSRV